MTSMAETFARLLDGPGPALFLVLLSLTLVIARRRAVGVAASGSIEPERRWLVALGGLGSLKLATDVVLRLPGLAHWQPPTDRLFGGLFMLAVGLAARPVVGAGVRAARRPAARPLLAVASAAFAALLVWLAYASAWAADVQRAATAAATGRAVLADVVLAGAGASAMAVLAGRRDGGWARGAWPALGALALGSALQAIAPTPGAATLWRAGLVAAGVCAAMGAAGRGAAARSGARSAARSAADWARTRARALAWATRVLGSANAAAGRGRRLGRWGAAGARRLARRVSAAIALLASASAAAASVVSSTLGRALAAVRQGPRALAARRVGRALGAGASARARLALARAVGASLAGILTDLDAAVVFMGLIEDDAVRFWALTPSGALQELYRRPLSQLPAVRRALAKGDGTLGSRTEARDVDDLFGHLGLPYDGPVLLAACGRPATAVLVAGSAYGPWHRDDPARLAARAAALGATLIELSATDAAPGTSLAAAAGGAGGAHPPAATADEVGLLRDAVAAMHADLTHFASRLDGIERRFDGQTAAAEALASTGLLVPSPVTSYLARLETYQRLLEPLPWGVVVADPDGRVLLANSAARRILIGAALLPGHRFDVHGPGARTLIHALRDPSSALAGTRVVLPTLDAVVRVESIERPNWRQRNRLGATIIVATAADAAAGGEADLVDLLEALRDPLVDLRIQGESIDAEVRMPAADLTRHLAVLDGHAAGLRAVLGALAARRSIALSRYQPTVSALDLGTFGANTERSLRDLFELRGIRFRGVRGNIPSDVRLDQGLLEQVALAVVAGAATTASWGSHLSVQLRHEPAAAGGHAGDGASRGASSDASHGPDIASMTGAIVVTVDMIDGGLTAMTQHLELDAAALAGHPAALRVAHDLALRGFPGYQAWFARRTPEDQRLQLCMRVPVGEAA